MKLTFLGAAGTVTGSRFLVEVHGRRLLVDCGLFQGLKELRLRNWARMPIDPAAIDAVVLTHAHIDHSGYLPALVRAGFTGPVWCTEGTAQLLSVLLPDAGHIQEEEAQYRNRTHTTRHDPALPLYTEEDGRRALDHLRTVPFGEAFSPVAQVTARFGRVGHILGAGCVYLDDGVTSVAFTGDVGRPDDPVSLPPDPLEGADHVVCESTYGGRTHREEDAEEALAAIVRRTVARNGKLVVPVFAVGRAQTILHLLAESKRKGAIPDVPVYLNSPMAIDATLFYLRSTGELRLGAAEIERAFRVAHFVSTVAESKALNLLDEPAILLAASGMATGGRVVHHLKAYLPDERSTVLLVGYQAAGTRGEALRRGVERLKIHGDYVPVRAEVALIDTLSAHADENELVAWLRTAPRAPRSVHLVHGEPTALDALRLRIADELRWPVAIARDGQSVELG
jgi:metallo-beta-lactamase family protein